jgi:thiol-disulfide isomerase/thioredoxin
MKKHFLLSTIAALALLTSLSAQSTNTSSSSPKSDEAIYPTKYLVEHFTASSCPPCQPMNFWMNPMYQQKHQEGKLIYIKYPMNWPGSGDPYYVAADGNPRRTFYGVNSVPMVFGNAVQHNPNVPTWPEFVDNLAAKIDAFSTTMSAYDIQFDSAYISLVGDGKSNLYVSYTITPNTTAQVNIHTVVYQERTIGNISSNGETEFFHTVMKMFPNGSGNVQSLVKDTPFKVTYEFDMSTTFMERINDLGLVVFLQNQSSRQILGAAERKISHSPVVVAPGITASRVGDSSLVTITGTAGTVHYTLTGNAPTTTSPVYNAPFWVNKNTTVKAMAYDGEWASMITTENVEFRVAQPTISHVLEEDGSRTVTITTATEGATIHYNRRNVASTTNDTIYTEPFSITSTTRVRAIAVKDGWTNSPERNTNITITNSSINDVENTLDLKIYPNPTDNYVNIEYSGNAKLSLFNVNGVLVYEGTMNGHIRLSLADYPSGMYVLRIVSDEGTATERIIKR